MTETEVIPESEPLDIPLAVRRRRRSVRTKLNELWDGRELLRSFVMRDLKVRYKNSILGFAWSLLTPLAMVLVFTFIFTQVFVVGGMDDFPLFFLAGFLAWQYFSNSVTGSVGSIVGNASLIKRVFFPHEFLPIATVLSQLIHFVLSLIPLMFYLAFKGYNFVPFLHYLLLAMVLQTFCNVGMSMAFAAANVGFRDLQELVQVIFLLWFYGTPIFYQLDMVPEKFRLVLMANPMAWYIDMYRHSLYYLQPVPMHVTLVSLAFAVGIFTLGYALFMRLARNFAKEV